MILTLAWKEYREHRSIWLTMVLVTGLMAYLLAPLIAPRDASMTQAGIMGIIVLGMAAAYGVVCGSMMLAGEAENGTQVFLDIFLGRRGLLWWWKLLVGALLAASEGLAVALVMYFMKQAPPSWLPIFLGQGAQATRDAANRIGVGPEFWLIVLPLVTLEAYAWGILGSSMARLVLTGAAIAAMIAAPFLLIALLTPPPASLFLRVIGVAAAVGVSCAAFMAQSRDVALGPPPKREEGPEAKWVEEVWDELDAYEPEPLMAPQRAAPVAKPQAARYVELETEAADYPAFRRAADIRKETIRKEATADDADSPWQVLWWLTFQQAWVVFAIMAGASLFLGIFMPSNGQVLWPLTTLAIGVACGTATFAPEQSERSHQFLAAGHFPLSMFWIVRTVFWLGAALAAALIAGGGILLTLLARSLPEFAPRGGQAPVGADFGTLREELGPVLFYGMWLVYGFCVGQVFVLLCRKNILAVLISAVVSAAAAGIWLPSLLCRGMSGWQVWLPPIVMLAGTWFLIRAWAAGRIKERKPMALLIGVGAVGLAWVGMQLAYRAWSIPDTGAPLDRSEFREAIALGNDNRGGRKIQDALSDFDNGPWLEALTQAVRLPVGVIETPPNSGPSPLPRTLDPAGKMGDQLARLAEAAWDDGRPDTALDHITRMLVLSRNLRNKAPVSAYMLGASVEESALGSLNGRLARSKPSVAFLKRALTELAHHAAETPPALDCVRTECYRAGGTVNIPVSWTFYAGIEGHGRVREGWLAGAIALSLELPWEEERKLRLWQAVWAGLLRGAETPLWQLPQDFGKLDVGKPATRDILRGWLPNENDSSMTRDRLVTLLDESWLSDPRLFAPVMSLRGAGARSRCRVDACRLSLALGLYQLQEGKTAARLADLVPKYLTELPIDPYSGESFQYRISQGEQLETADRNGDDGPRRLVDPGQGVLWSIGPDRTDHGGRKDAAALPDDHPRWLTGGFDLVTVVPRWR